MSDADAPPRWPAYARVPPFVPVPLRGRSDGWTPERQGRFVGVLAETGSVAAAARAAGMSRMSAYRLRLRAEAGSFAHAWDSIMAIRRGETLPARKVTVEELAEQALHGPMVVFMRRRRFVRAHRKPSTSALLRHLRRLDAAAKRGGWDWP